MPIKQSVHRHTVDDIEITCEGASWVCRAFQCPELGGVKLFLVCLYKTLGSNFIKSEAHAQCCGTQSKGNNILGFVTNVSILTTFGF